MEPFLVNILGCGSALPTRRHIPSCQVVQLKGRSYVLDCGEGAQLQMRRMHIPQQRIGPVFITHLHGDHCFGLMGLLSSMSLQGRTGSVDIYGPAPLRHIFQPQIDYFASGARFSINIHEISHEAPGIVYSDSAAEISAVPLRHRMPCVGYVIREKKNPPHIRRDMIDILSIPHYAINRIKQGEGWTTPDGRHFPSDRLVTPSAPPRSYAYITDTRFSTGIIPAIRGVTLLYHEATYSAADASRAPAVMHSTSVEAATIAQQAGVGRLLLGHFSARYDDEQPLLNEAREIFPHTLLADEGMRLEV